MVENKEINSCHSRVLLSGISTLEKKAAEVPDNNLRVRQYCKAFTLIELLVVVLIIGILSAIALPQYQVAVLKSRLMQGVIYAKYLHDAQEMYHLANGSYAASADDLGIDLAAECPAKWTCQVRASDVMMQYDNQSLSITYIYNHRNDDWRGVLYCYASTADAKLTKACKSLGTDWKSDENAVRYRIN